MDRALWLQTDSLGGEWHRKNRGSEAAEVTTRIYLKKRDDTRGKLQSNNVFREEGHIVCDAQGNSSTHKGRMLICVLTVLGLVRFLASVSQLLRWLYVLLLHDINRGTEVTMTTGKDLVPSLRRDQ